MRTWPVVIRKQLNKGFPILLRSLVFNIFHTLEEKFRIPARPYNILYFL